MFKLVGIMGDLFAVQDTDDEVIDVLPKSKVCKCLNLGLQIGGITQVSSSEFEYTNEFFPQSEVDEDEDEDDYSDYYEDENEEDENEEDEYYSSEDEYETEEDENEEEDDYYNSDDFGDEYNTDEDAEGDEEEDDYYNSDDFDDGYSDEDFGIEEEEVSTVNKLYSHLNEDQIKLLKRYYLWFSQRIFDEGHKQQRTLQVTNNPRKLQKQRELDVMRNQGGLWAYAGFIDMGYRGADYCTLGHPLRYVHLAWDISVSDIETSFFGEEYNSDIEQIINSSNCIKFGIDCISDFFEIDKEYTDKLKKAQREAMKDMDFMCQYYEDGNADEVIASFTVMDEIVNNIVKTDARGMLTIGDKYTCLIPKSLTSFYRQFRQLNLVLPKSLVQEIRDNLVGWDSHKFTGWREPKFDVIANIVNKVVGGKTKYIDFDKFNYNYSAYKQALSDYFVEFFQLKSCGYYEYNADTFKDEGGASKPVKAQLYAVHDSIKNKFWSDVEFTFDYIKRLLSLEARLDSIDDLVNSYKTPSCSFEDGRYCTIAYSELYNDALRDYDEDNDTHLMDYLNELLSINRRFRSICKSKNGGNYSLSEYSASLDEKLNHLTSELEKYKEFAKNKLQKYIDDKNAEIDKELAEKLEKERKEKELEDKKQEIEAKTNLSDDEIRQYCIDNADKVKNDTKLKFALTVLDTVKKSGKCSSKQMYYVKQIYEKLTGVQSTPSKVQLDDRKDIEQAIDTVLANTDLLSNVEDSEKVSSILKSIKRYRTISERQMKYAEIALKVVKGE